MKPNDPRHGSTNGYSNLECRCQRCRDAWAAYVRGIKAQRMAQITPGDPRHGTPGYYGNHGCRCAACTEAWAKARLLDYRRRRAEHATVKAAR